MKTWIKLHTEIIDDFDQCTLTWAQRGIWSAMLALCGKIDDRDADGRETGIMDTPERVAFGLRMSPTELDDALAAFVERDMARIIEGGAIWLPHYADRQARKPSDAPERVAERVQRYRASKAESSNADVTPCNADVTPLKRPVTRSEAEAEAEIEAEAEAEAEAAGPEDEREDALQPLLPPDDQELPAWARRAWYEELGALPSPRLTTDLEGLARKYPEWEWWEYALGECAQHNSRNVRYLERCLQTAQRKDGGGAETDAATRRQYVEGKYAALFRRARDGPAEQAGGT